MALQYSGSATLHCDAGIFPIHADLRTDVSGGVYSWGGRLHTHDPSAIGAARQGGTLTLSAPAVDSAVHVVVADLNPAGGVLLRIHGTGRAPYEEAGEIVTRPREGGGTVYLIAE